MNYSQDYKSFEKEILIGRLQKHTQIENNHWLWMGGRRGKAQHGCLRIGSKMYSIHRISAFLFLNFDLNSDKQINHKPECNIAWCWNPEHLYVGTQYENVHDSMILGTYKGWEVNGPNPRQK